MTDQEERDELRYWWRMQSFITAAFHADETSPEEWAEAVRAIEVDLRPGGRAVMRAPGVGYRLELFWVFDRESPDPARIWEVQLIGESEPVDGEVLSGFRAEPYLAALNLALGSGRREFAKRIPRRRPKPGQPLDTDFYRRILELHDELIADGHPAPANDIARRMKDNPTTVRGWIHRARKLQGRER